MQSDYLIHLKKWLRFNQWENLQRKELEPAAALHQFLTLFELSSYLPKDLWNQYHHEHLKTLIEIQKNLMTAKRKENSG